MGKKEATYRKILEGLDKNSLIDILLNQNKQLEELKNSKGSCKSGSKAGELALVHNGAVKQ